MKEKIKNIVLFLVAVGIGAAVVFLADRRSCGKPQGDDTQTQVDSVKTQIDTTTAVAPEPSESRDKDTVYIKVYLTRPSAPVPTVQAPSDTTHESADSVLYIPIKLEQKVYEDSTYRAVVSGPAIEQYGPRLDSISVYRRTVTVYQTKTVYSEPSRWGIGIQAGYGASKDGLTPYIGIGVQYNLWSPKKRRF